MSTSHLLRILAPAGVLDGTIRDYAHNLLVSTDLQRLGAAAIRQLHVIDVVKVMAAMHPDAEAKTRGKTERRQPEKELELGLSAYLRHEGTAPRAPATPGEPLDGNIETLLDLLDLSAIDGAILQFLTVVQLDGGLSNLVDSFGDVSVPLAAAVIAAATNAPFRTVQSALSPESSLRRSGAIVLERRVVRFSNKVHLRWGVLDLAVTPGLTRAHLLSRFLPRACAPSLQPSDYAHVAREVRLVTDLLSACLRDRRQGVHLLLHGPTGTGKTELARLLACELGAELFMVQGDDDAGEPAEPSERLSSLLLGQRLLRTARSLLLFDEMEDLFGRRKADEERLGKPTMGKQWFTSFLERNQVPVVWITNSLRGVDRAYLRRFTYSIELRELNLHRRAEILAKCVGESRSLSKPDIAALAQYRCSPAQVAASVSSARLVSGDRPTRDQVEQFLAPAELLVSGRQTRPSQACLSETYRADLVNSSEDLDAVTSQLERWRPSADVGVSLYLFGPPGTGKSEYVRYLASRMGLDVVQRNGSDLISKWVGETEKNIAEAFRDAEAHRALLLFDEADTFLRSRQLAAARWEVTEVNEFLQQLEHFRGVAACTTNLWEDIDEAALRRFVFKIEFRPMRDDQAVSLFGLAFGELVDGELDRQRLAIVRDHLRARSGLTPGDFAAVRRRVRALGSRTTVTELLRFLDVELRAKKVGSRHAGFAQP